VTILLVQGTDPSLRDREVQRAIDELLGPVDRSLALDDHTVESRRRGGAADAEPTDDEPSSSGSLELPAFTAIVNALQSPPFMTECRVVVVREIGNLTSDQAKWLAEWMADPLPGVHLVLVLGGGRVSAALDKAVKALADVVGPASEQTSAALANATKAARLKLSSEAATRIASHFGDDAGRVPELVELLRATYGTGATLGVDDVEAYLGDLGTAGRFDLANAIDRGDVGTALEVLHRMLTATSARQDKPVHPLVVMAMLISHYQRFLRLDDPAIVTKEQAAEALGMRSAAGARFPLDATRRLGSDGLREAMGLLARAELDLRGTAGTDERTVIEILVARLAHLSRRRSRAATPARR
jgi:DNA polymerase III subunit delta